MEALHDVVKAGKARYLGASSMYRRDLDVAVIDRAADVAAEQLTLSEDEIARLEEPDVPHLVSGIEL